MSGHTDALVLEAPVLWWPSLQDLPRYPIDGQRSLMAVLAEAAMPWPSVPAAPSVLSRISSVGLSRLGRSVMMMAKWSRWDEGEEENASSPLFVEVWDPLQGCSVHLPVSTEVGLGAVYLRERNAVSAGSSSSKQDVSVADSSAFLRDIDLEQLTRDNRIRLTHTSLSDVMRKAVRSKWGILPCGQRWAQECDAYLLLHRAVSWTHAAARKHLKRIAEQLTKMPSQCLAAFSPASSSCTIPFVGSLLYTGDTASQRHLLDLLRMCTPSITPVTDTPVFALETRRLNFTEVLTLDDQEVVETVEAVLRPPVLSESFSSTFMPCLLVVLEGLHLLEANANSLVASATHQLCLSLDALQAGPVPVLVWSFAENIREVPAGLLARVGSQQMHISHVAVEDRRAYLTRRAKALLEPHDSAMETGRTGMAGLVEGTAHYTVAQLMQLTAVELARSTSSMLSPSEETSSRGCPRQQQWPTEELDAASEAEALFSAASAATPLHRVYDHLYGMDEAIHKMEELAVWPLTHLPLLQDLSIPCSTGVLLCGPSGSGKTALLSSLVRRLKLPDARGVHVMSVDGLSLIEKEVGRSEKNIAQLFDAAHSLAPTALFIDNLEALAPPRGRTTTESDTTSDRTLSTLLTQMDGVDGRKDRVVLVVASAPSLHTLDAAVYRPGRLDVHVQLKPAPVAAAVAFMKQQLHAYVDHMKQHNACEKDVNEETTVSPHALDEVDALVEEVFCQLDVADGAASAGGADGSAFFEAAHRHPAPSRLSPAEVTAMIREVMLCATEQLEHCKRSDTAAAVTSRVTSTPPSQGDVIDAVRDALQRVCLQLH